MSPSAAACISGFTRFPGTSITGTMRASRSSMQYGPAHEVHARVRRPAALRWPARERVRVNSLHWQGIERLGQGLAVEARAPDGLIEAFRVEGAPRFALAVQWHPEWKVMDNPFSRALFAAFGAACRDRAESR